jgi:predicted DNA-binding antitoxin AbrB/MazE fold protein
MARGVSMPPIEPIEAEPIEVVYENGVLRPVHPLDLAEGTRLEVTVRTLIDATDVATPGAPSTGQEQDGESQVAEIDESEYLVFLDELDEIAALALKSSPQAHTARP